MKKNYLIIAISILLVCCTSKENNNANIQKDSVAPEKGGAVTATLTKDARKIGPEKSSDQLMIESALKKMEASNDNNLLGCWVGKFGQTKINVFLAFINGSEIEGHSVCAGNFREIKGTIKENENNTYTVEMKEPGDNKYDGTFKFTIDKDKQKITGDWTPFNAGATSAKKYSLSKRVFKYDPTVGKYPDGSGRLLATEEVANMLPEDLKMMRNEIYARHGYSFRTKAIRSTFDEFDWYFPVCVDVRDQLTDTEVKNIDLLYKYEQYYEQSYDDYGR